MDNGRHLHNYQTLTLVDLKSNTTPTKEIIITKQKSRSHQGGCKH